MIICRMCGNSGIENFDFRVLGHNYNIPEDQQPNILVQCLKCKQRSKDFNPEFIRFEPVGEFIRFGSN